MPTNTAHSRRKDHGDGLHEDLVKLASRRDALRIFGVGTAAAILSTLGASQALAATSRARCRARPRARTRATAPTGPTCSTTRHRRHDIRRSFGSSRTLAKGVPLRVNLTVTDAANDYAPMAGAAVYLWHSIAPAGTRCTPPGSRTRTTCAGSRRPTARAPPGSRRSSRAAIRGAGRTSTSRCIRRSPKRSPTARSSRHRSRAAAGGMQEGLRDQRILGQPEQPRKNVAVDRQRLQRRRGDPPTRDRDRKRQTRLRRKPHHRHLIR